MQKFDFQICHIPGKELYTADTLSRAPVAVADQDALKLQEEVETFISEVTHQLADRQLQEYCAKQAEDPVCSQVVEFSESQWPHKRLLLPQLIPYWKVKESFSVSNELLLFNDRIVIPEAMRKDVVRKLHEGHLGIEKCRQRLRTSVWWPNANKQVSDLIENCPE